MPDLRGLLSRIGQGARTAANTAGDVLMPEPEGMDSLLNPGDVQRARSQGLIGMGAGLLNSRGGGLSPIADGLAGAQKSYAGSLAGTMEQRQAGQEYQQTQDALQKKAALAQQYPVRPNMTADELRQVYMAYMQAGVQIPQGLSEIIKSMDEKVPKPQTFNLGGHTIVRHPDGREERLEHTPTPKNPGEFSAEQSSAAQQRMFGREQQLSSLYIRETAEYAKVANNFGTVAALQNAAAAGNPQAQIGMVFAFMKGLDPGSVVRESEYATAANAAGVPERVRNMYNKALKGQFMSANQVNSMAEQSRSTAAMWQKRLAPTRKRYVQRAKDWGVDASFITPDYFEVGFGGPGAAPAAPAPAAPANGNRIRGVKR